MAAPIGQNLTDIYYPSVLTPFKELDAQKVDDAIRRAYDLIYKISPSGSLPYTTTSVVADRSYDAITTTLGELANVLGTLIADLKSKGYLS